MTDGIATRARFDQIRYAQVWEDADVLLAALSPAPGATLVSIASAGDNVLALLTTDPARVIAADLSEAQLACLALRIGAIRALDHAAFLELMGARPSRRRAVLLSQAIRSLSPARQAFWSARQPEIELFGAAGVGRFERYFRLFRQRILPLVHNRARARLMLEPAPPAARIARYDAWNNWRWHLLLRLFFSRTAMGRLGRDPTFFQYAPGNLPAHIAARTRAALVDQDPSGNPYLAWILTGTHGAALPLAWRAEHYETIRARLDRIELRQCPIEDAARGISVDGWNLSDIFEYMSPAEHAACYSKLLDTTQPGGRLVYWNMLAARAAPPAYAPRVTSHTALAARLHAEDRAFFYRSLVIEERL